jgi:nitrogenase molybdenum-iron protein alpha/beta subunit
MGMVILGLVKARDSARLNQVVCTLEGMCTLLMQTPGNFAVVIHGDRDCVNVLAAGEGLAGAERFFCTHLSEEEAVAGRSLRRLRACLELVCTRTRPETVFLLGTCLTALIGDDVEASAKSIAEQTGVAVVPLSGGGMRFVSQATVTDRFARLMLDACPAGQSRDRSVNLVGFHPGEEVLSLLEKLGIGVNAVLVPQTPISTWKTLPAAQVNLVLDEGLYAGFLKEARSRFGTGHLQVPYPVGHRATAEFFEKVLSLIPAGADAGSILGPPGEAARREVERAHSRGVRLGYNIGSMKNMHPLTLALEGLADLPAFEELGFDPVILVQGDDRPERAAAVSETLQAFGCRAPFAIFSDTVFFADLCRKQECRLVCASDHLRDQVRRSGAGFMAHQTLQPGYSAAGTNIARITSALEERAPGGS